MRFCPAPEFQGNVVIRIFFEGYGQGHEVIGRLSRGRISSNRHRPVGKRAGFVEYKGIDLPGLLKGCIVPHEDSFPPGKGNTGHTGQRNSQPQCTGTGNDQYGDGPDQRFPGTIPLRMP